MIELLIVVSVMGILAAVGVPKLFSAIENSKRRIDGVNATELSNILIRAFDSDAIQFPTSGNAKLGLTADDFSIAVIVTNEGTNYYRGSGEVVVNGGNWKADKGVAYSRVRKLFEEAGFANVKVNATNNEDGWACYGVVLFNTGKTHIFSSREISKCVSGTADGAYEELISNTLSSNDNPIANYVRSTTR